MWRRFGKRSSYSKLDEEEDSEEREKRMTEQSERENAEMIRFEEQKAEEAGEYERGGQVTENRYKVPTQVHSFGYEPFNRRK